MQRSALLLIMALTACTSGTHDALVLVDAGARESGVAIEIEGVDRTSVLPISVPEGLVHIYRDGDPEIVELFPGDLLHVHEDGLSIASLGYDIDVDAVEVNADEDGLDELAYLVGADASHGFSPRLVGDDVLLALADLDVPEGVLEVRTIGADVDSAQDDIAMLSGITTYGTPSHTSVTHTLTMKLGVGGSQADVTKTEAGAKAVGELTEAGSGANPLHVGVYVHNNECLILDAGGFATYCGDDTKRMWTSDGDKVLLHNFMGEVTLTMHDDNDRVQFPNGSAFARAEAK